MTRTESDRSRVEARARERAHFEDARIILELLDSFKNKGLRYVVVGGFGLQAIANEKYSAERENGTMRDLDVIILECPDTCMADLETEIARLRREGILGSIELSLKEAHTISYRNKKQIVSSIKHSVNGGFSLVFRGVESPLPSDALASERASISLSDSHEKVAFDTLSPVILLGLYKTRFGFVKPKDSRKLALFTALAYAKGLFSKGDKEILKIFDDFAEQMRTKYRLLSLALFLTLLFDHYILGSHLSHRIIPLSLRKQIIQS